MIHLLLTEKNHVIQKSELKILTTKIEVNITSSCLV